VSQRPPRGRRAWRALALAALALTAGIAYLADPTAAAEKADRIFINGRVWTGEPGKPLAEALAVRAQTILAVGTTDQIQRHKEKETDVVDLRGRFVYPGFHDSHIHFVGGSLTLGMVDLSDAWSVEEIQRRIVAYAKANPQAEWIVGRGWFYGAFPGGMPHKKYLDTVVPDRPVWMTGYDGHTGWANSVALHKAGITPLSKDPENGVIVKDDKGEPTGVLKEAAQRLVRQHVPLPDSETKYRLLRKGLDLAASYGLTSVHNAGFDEADLPVFDRLLTEGVLKVRMYTALYMVKDPTPEVLTRYRELRDRYKSNRFRFGAIKGLVDGVVEAQTAAMFEPYPGGGTGLPNYTPEELDRTVTLYDREGYQIFLHAIGDRGIHLALNAYEKAARMNGPRERRHRVEHIEAPRFEDIARFKPLGVIASTQPLFMYPNQNHLEVYVPMLGPGRAKWAMAFKSIDDAGAVQAFGSDWPVFSCEVLKGLHAAVTRTTVEGTPAGGWNPEQRITAEAALRHYTSDGAYASFEERQKGTLAPGKLADFVVVTADLRGAPEGILKAKVVHTVMGGQDTYRAPGL
jgi:predicted amidohydrolase YtcJ